MAFGSKFDMAADEETQRVCESCWSGQQIRFADVQHANRWSKTQMTYPRLPRAPFIQGPRAY
jgi:hypothetical protein